MEDKELTAFAASLRSEVTDRALGDMDGGDFAENAFVDLVSEHLGDIGMIENPITCHFSGKCGPGLVKLSGYGVPDDGERVDLLVAIFNPDGVQVNIAATDVNRTAGQAARAIQFVQRGLHLDMETATDGFAMMERLSDLLASDVRHARVLLLTNGLSPVSDIPPITMGDVTIAFEVYDLRRLMRTMGSGQAREVIDIDLASMDLPAIPCVTMPTGTENYETYLAVFSGESLYRMYEMYGPRILEFNVRAFLQATGKVNKGIRDTIRDEPGYFMAYNNGISVTADEVRTAISPNGLVITGFRGLQIVNGGQTTASIHRARKRDRLDLSRVNVPAKVTRLPPENVETMVPQISRFANTQNVIQEADFSSNEPFHIAIERLSKAVWSPGERTRWFYERSRGQYQTAMSIEGSTPARLRAFRERTPPSRRLAKTDLARVVNSWNRLPHVVSGGTQKNFVAFMRKLRDVRGTRWEPDEAYYRDVVAQAILFAAAQRVVRQEGFPAYRINIAIYLVAYLSHRTGGNLRLDMIWDKQGVSPDLDGLMRTWSGFIDREIQETAGGRNVTEWCKKEACWAAIKSLDLTTYEVLPPEWGARSEAGLKAETATVDADEHAATARCMQLTAEHWFAIHLWGKRTGHLANWQAGIAHTLSGYAGGGWQKTPTLKQAKHALKILETATEMGFASDQETGAVVGASSPTLSQ